MIIAQPVEYAGENFHLAVAVDIENAVADRAESAFLGGDDIGPAVRPGELELAGAIVAEHVDVHGEGDVDEIERAVAVHVDELVPAILARAGGVGVPGLVRDDLPGGQVDAPDVAPTVDDTEELARGLGGQLTDHDGGVIDDVLRRNVGPDSLDLQAIEGPEGELAHLSRGPAGAALAIGGDQEDLLALLAGQKGSEQAGEAVVAGEEIEGRAELAGGGIEHDIGHARATGVTGQGDDFVVAVAVKIVDPCDLGNVVARGVAEPQGLALRVKGMQSSTGDDQRIRRLACAMKVGRCAGAGADAQKILACNMRLMSHVTGQRLITGQATVMTPHRPIPCRQRFDGGDREIGLHGQRRNSHCTGGGLEEMSAVHAPSYRVRYTTFNCCPPNDRETMIFYRAYFSIHPI